MGDDLTPAQRLRVAAALWPPGQPMTFTMTREEALMLAHSWEGVTDAIRSSEILRARQADAIERLDRLEKWMITTTWWIALILSIAAWALP